MMTSCISQVFFPRRDMMNDAQIRHVRYYKILRIWSDVQRIYLTKAAPLRQFY